MEIFCIKLNWLSQSAKREKNGIITVHLVAKKDEVWRPGPQKICLRKFFANPGAKLHFFRHKKHRDKHPTWISSAKTTFEKFARSLPSPLKAIGATEKATKDLRRVHSLRGGKWQNVEARRMLKEGKRNMEHEGYVTNFTFLFDFLLHSLLLS